MVRKDFSDAEWELIGALLLSERGRWARPAGDNHHFLNGMLHVPRVGCPRRDVHERSGTAATSAMVIVPAKKADFRRLMIMFVAPMPRHLIVGTRSVELQSL